MTDLPPGDPFHEFDNALFCEELETFVPPPGKGHWAHVQMKDLNDGVKYATRLALDRARQAGHNPRNGYLTVFFSDDGVGCRWDPKP